MFGLDRMFSMVLDRFFGGIGSFLFCSSDRYLGSFDGLSSNGAFATISAGIDARTDFASVTFIILSPVTLPITEQLTRNFLQICWSFGSFFLSVMINILSWDSEVMIS